MEIILWLQSFRNPFLDSFWSAITQLGSQQFLLIVALLVFWCVNSRVGWLLFILGGMSLVSNELIKDLVAAPRPDPSLVRVVMPAGGYAFPSGHAQHTTVLWGFISLRLGRSTIWLIPAALFISLVGLSRLYLGVHWPADVIGGFIIGAMIVALGNWALTRWADDWIASEHAIYKAAALFIPLAVFAVFPKDIVTRAMGFLVGLNGGYLILLPRFGGAYAAGSSRKRLLVKAVIGLAGLALIVVATRAALPDAALFRLSAYAIMGLWAGFVVPRVFGGCVERAASTDNINHELHEIR
ncbi:MAG: phosphatase PAP2 family protein [Chloroflexi bacterium]|nr:phosphatase PAP2 family protein [Chloroflexota bacterium]